TFGACFAFVTAFAVLTCFALVSFMTVCTVYVMISKWLIFVVYAFKASHIIGGAFVGPDDSGY
ncbi:hypothetical protein KIPB_012476, partial [Kipferlia bialata]